MPETKAGHPDISRKKKRKKRAGKTSPLYQYLSLEIGKRLRAQRLSLGLTLSELSDAAGISLSFLSDIEHGRTLPGLETFCVLCHLLRLSPDLPAPPLSLLSGTSAKLSEDRPENAPSSFSQEYLQE